MHATMLRFTTRPAHMDRIRVSTHPMRAVRVRSVSRVVMMAVAANPDRVGTCTKETAGGLKVEVALGIDGSGSVECETGLPFLDHMLDQLGTHGLLDLNVKVSGRTDDMDDETVNNTVGAAVGAAISQLQLSSGVRAEFYSPLDESLQGVTVDFAAPAALSFASPIPTARVGRYATRLMQPFYAALVAEAGMAVDIRRLCDAPNCNSHHIIEATFKAFARAMRAALDVMDARADGPFVVGDVRTAAIHRATGETSIDVEVTLDGHGSHTGTTTIPLLDRQLAELAAASGVSLRVDAVGDTHIDDHHTVEDTAIVIGKALQAALGDRSGINRMGFACEKVGEAEVHATLDLSGRPHLGFEVDFADERVGEFDTQLVEHTYQSLANNSGMTLHVRKVSAGGTSEDVVIAAARAVGRALRMGVRYDERRGGKIASSKGTLTL